MFQPIRLLVVATLIWTPTCALAGPAEDASAAIDRWAATYTANDADAITKLYASDALLHGTSSPTLNKGSIEIRKHFDALPAIGNKVSIADRTLSSLGQTPPLG